MTLKIAFVGAGSRSFARRVFADILLSDLLCQQEIELALMDVVAEHLTDNAAYARQAVAQLQRPVRVSTTTALEPALEGADFVITAVEVNRYLYWAQDFHIPRKYGFRQVYGENGGIGGIFHALRNMGPMVNIARTMERLCPDAWLLNFANPEQRLIEAITRLTSVKAVGLCHGVLMGQKQIAMILDRPLEELEMAACGINHFTWFQTVRDRQTGEDLYPLLRERALAGDPLAHWHDLALGRVLLRQFGLWPSPATNHYGEYIRWADEFMASEAHYYYDPADGHPWETGRIPEFVYTIDRVNTDRPWIGDPTKGREHVEGDDRGLRPSGELAAPLMEGVACGVTRPLDAINVPNRGAIPELPDDLVVEAPGVADADGVRTAQMAALPEPIASLIRTQASIHKLIVEAFAEGSKNKLMQAVLLEPTVDSYRRAVPMVDEFLALQKDLLPELR
jgi:alpha-galactosidase